LEKLLKKVLLDALQRYTSLLAYRVVMNVVLFFRQLLINWKLFSDTKNCRS